MRETKSTDHTFSVTISNALYKRIKGEHSVNTTAFGNPVASYGVIGRLIEICDKRLKSVTLNYKGK
jgi:plastocyanin domain-containing protein